MNINFIYLLVYVHIHTYIAYHYSLNKTFKHILNISTYIPLYIANTTTTNKQTNTYRRHVCINCIALHNIQHVHLVLVLSSIFFLCCFCGPYPGQLHHPNATYQFTFPTANCHSTIPPTPPSHMVKGLMFFAIRILYGHVVCIYNILLLLFVLDIL